MSNQDATPPKWLDRLMECYCRPELLEDLQGDLHEYYHRNRTRKSKRFADLVFFIDVLKFFRLYTIRTPKALGHMTFIHLSKNYFKTSMRSLSRNRLFSAINIVGLSISMSIGILMITYLSELLSFDQFHENRDRIYRVNSHWDEVTEDAFDMASNSVYLGKKIKEEIPEIDEVLLLRRHFRRDVAKGDHVISVHGHFAEPSFFQVFSFDMIAGNPETALSEPYSLVLTETVAQKLFDHEPALGKIVTSRGESYKVTGVMKDVPFNSHIRFEVLCSFKTAEAEAIKTENETFLSWGSIWMNHIYLLLPENQNPSRIQAHLDRIAAEENETRERYEITFSLQKLTEITPGPDLSNTPGPAISWKEVSLLIVLILIVIVSSCFNYTNLSIARSLRRMKEVGIRKVVGANRSQVFAQFLFEAIILSTLALVTAFGLYQLIKPYFVDLMSESTPLNMQFQWVHVLYFLLFAVLIGCLAGGLPAWVLSKVRTISILQDASGNKLMKGIGLRKVLIIFQFVISMALIIAATIDYRQYRFSINYDLGFRTDNVVNLLLQGNDAELLVNELSQIPEIRKISMSGMLPNTGEQWGENVKYQDPMDSVSVHINHVNKDYFDLHELTFVAGSSWPFDHKDTTQFIVIDEMLRKRLGFENPVDAVGETLSLNEGDWQLKITGVINDYQYTQIEYESRPRILVQATADYLSWINLMVNTEDPVQFMNKIEKVWSGIDKVHPMEATYYKDRIERSYRDYKMMFEVFSFLAFLAISIAAMGLLGMAVFTTETRMKEISVRKVLGASANSLFMLMSRGFLWMFIIAAFIAMPLTYLLFEQVILIDMANRINVSLFDLLSGVLAILLIGLTTILWQTNTAVRSNPAEILRNE